MDNCFSSKLNVQASGFFRFSHHSKFRKIIKYVKEETSTLSKIRDKQTFRSGCLGLSKYLINNKSPPVYYRDLKDMWEGAIKNWVKSHYENLNIHGGCPVVMDEDDMKILELKYEEEDFCKKRDTYLNEINQLKSKHLKKCNDDYLRKCSEYNVWINLKKTYFYNNKSLIQNCYHKQKPSGNSIRKKGPALICDILNQEIFNEPTDCLLSSTVVSCETSTKNKHEIEIRRTEVTNESPSMPHVKKEENTQIAQEVQLGESEAIIQEENTQLPLQESRETIINKTAVIQTENVPTSGGHTNFESSHNSTPQGMFKKKRKISRRHVKFLRLLVPSYSNKKSKIFTDDYLEHTLYNDENIIKKIKINEVTKNINSSKRKKDRSKIIVEVHMEVLKEYKNEEWEKNKDEFLEICIYELEKKDFRTCHNLTDDDLIKKNITYNNYINKKKFVWNKWVKKNRNLSEKLKKENWFHNLMIKWKRELDYIQEMEVFKKKSSNKNKKISFLEREKDIWKQWISKNGMIIEQYLEEEYLKELTGTMHNISEEWINDETTNYISLINREEFQSNGNYKELYKYIKKTLLTNLCILVLMTILEECKNEANFENRESYLDNSINELKEEDYSDKKQEITENIIEYNCNDLESARNKEMNAHIGEHSFRNEIEDWIRGDGIHENSIVNDGTLDKSYKTIEKYIL
ncbi:hypothetical protein MKS88_000368 [Plasmodium brasilianum]|uniref:Uncharacterized protein n=1 Tax=Plasmodium brasilianum TaxID=5824 RepID=A0ACB9YHH7_PLABR|nr:hypothetical protein MKS88_000368 [Plasmodium brasilianum]